MLIRSAAERRRPPSFLRFDYDGAEWDIIVHASIPFLQSEPMDMFHEPLNHSMPYHVALVVGGHGHVLRDHHQWPLGRGDLLLVNPGVHTSLRPQGSDRLHLLPFSFNLRQPDGPKDLTAPLLDVLAQWADEPLRPQEGPVHLDDLRAVQFQDLLLALNSHMLPGLTVEWFPLHQRAFDLLAFTVSTLSAAGGTASIDPAMSLVRDHIERRFTESLSLDHLARIAGLSPYYLCRKFKAAYGVPPQQYQQYIQIRAACNYLRTTTLRVREIARETGFASPEHFTRLFRKRVGRSPSAFRRRGPSEG